MKILVLDTEYTGHVVWKEPDGKTVVAADDPRQPRIAQMAWLLFDGAHDKVLCSADYKVLPDGWVMPDELVAKLGHGLTTERLEREGGPIADVLDEYQRFYRQCDVLVGFNFQGDLKLIRGEQRRLGRPDSYKEKVEIDVMRACTKVCAIPPTEAMRANRMRTPFKTPSLSEAAKILLGVDHSGAHDALADCDITARLFFRLLADRHIEIAPPLPPVRVRDEMGPTPPVSPHPAPVGDVSFLS